MAQPTSLANTVPSPAATGGAGTFFEQHVGAYWLSHLLVRGIPPILHDCCIVEVGFQVNRLGWNTDDFLVTGEAGSGSRHQLLGQVKRTFTVSATDDDCKKAIQDFWRDFHNAQLFSPATDRLTLVTLRGTQTLLEYFSGLLDCARVSRDGVEFTQRLTTKGLLNAKAVHYCEVIRSIVTDVEGRAISTEELWPFLRVLHVLSLDLNTATRQTEAMVKSLLAHTTADHDPVGAADATWNALLRVIGEAMPEARDYRQLDLPESLRRRHTQIGSSEQRTLRALADHSGVILGGIRSTIGLDLHLQRGRLVQQLLDHLDIAQVVLVSGPAGSGKSGVAKDVVCTLAADHFTFSFRAEEFARPHIDETLRQMQVPASAAVLGSILATQGRKILLVESVERLLEASTRDAFTDLLTLVTKDSGWRLILTCRDYSADLVRSCFLEASRVGHAVLAIPQLGDDELEEVRRAHPALTRPLASPALRQILCNPYVLDKALQIRWGDEQALPQNEREFRALFWREIVRVDQRPAGGMPRRRDDAFVQVALRRARALTLHAPCDDMDAEVTAALQADSLVAVAGANGTLLAPAHDVLEDWAILHWLDVQYELLDGSVRHLADAVGSHPAVRRTYRKWVSELVQQNSSAADAVFRAVLHDGDLPPHFRDDTLISLLRSPASAALLGSHSTELLANDKHLLRRIIHLLRVACVAAPPWLPKTQATATLFYVPDGPSWGCVLRLAQNNLDVFSAADCGLLLGLIEDWARGVTVWTPYPDAAEATAAIAHWLLPRFGGYRSKDQQKRTIQVIAKIPNADRKRFARLLRGSRDPQKRRQESQVLRELVFDGTEGTAAARDLPKTVCAVALRYLLSSEDDLRRRREYVSDLGLETLFGIKSGRHHGFFPASAFRGPLCSLLQHHPRQGIRLMIGVFNHSAEWYARPRVRSEYVEPPFETPLTFADGTTRVQWCNSRLWNLYRGTSVGPYVLQSMLMAFERWLLSFAEAYPQDLDALLTDILKRSGSAALTAVVASVATAHPRRSGETLLVLLGSPVCILLDRQRLSGESGSTSKLMGMMPRLDGRNAVYEEERKQADALPHRGSDLETAIANLQLGPCAERVHAILDHHRAELPPVEEQSDAIRMWRLALHRMDLRQYRVADKNTPSLAEEVIAEDAPQQIPLMLNTPDPDLQEMAEQTATHFHALNVRIGALMWGMQVFQREEGGTHDPSRWRERLTDARRIEREGIGGGDPGHGAPGYIAAVCVRDHWDELTQEEREWCTDHLCGELERTANQWNHFARVQRYQMAPDRPAAWVIPLLVGKNLADDRASRVRRALVTAITHPVTEVRWSAAQGVGKYLWTVDRQLTLHCVNAIALEATLLHRAVEAESERLRQAQDFQRYHSGEWHDQIAATVATDIHHRVLEGGEIPDDAYANLDMSERDGAEAGGRILTILEVAPTEPAAVDGFTRLAVTLVEWWDADDERQHDERQRRYERHYETESALADRLETFLARSPTAVATAILQPILCAIDRHPKEVERILQGLIQREDQRPNPRHFWSLWALFAERVRQARWLPGIDGEYAEGKEMVSAIFLGRWWKEHVRHWTSLQGYADRVHALFETLPPSAAALEHYARFLYRVGGQSLPAAFIGVARQVQKGNTADLMRNDNTIFILESILQRYVYGRPRELKQHAELRSAVLTLLDILVELGSSAAFRMRDDFVTPASAH